MTTLMGDCVEHEVKSKGFRSGTTYNQTSFKKDTCSRFDNGLVQKENANRGEPIRKREEGAGMPSEVMSKITCKQVLNAASSRYRDHIPMHSRALEWSDLVQASYALLPQLEIHPTAWQNACATMGRNLAAVCVMIIDRKLQEPGMSIRSPGGYLRAMASRAASSELNLLGSIFGLLRREEGAHVD